MSAGHGVSGVQLGEHELDKALADPKIRARLARRPVLDRSYDIPYLAGYSRDGKIVFIDRHFPDRLRIGTRVVNVIPFLLLHETIEKALMDVYGWHYQPAHQVATRYENRGVRRAGFLPDPYNDALKPYIKADEIEKIIRIPADYDLTPIIESHDYKVLHRVRMLMNKAQFQKATQGIPLPNTLAGQKT